MEHLFFNMGGSFDDVARVVFDALGLSFVEGDSANVLGGDYRVASSLGVEIRLERNSYDYEDKYEYMLSIRKKLGSPLRVEPVVAELVSRAVARLIADNANVTVAREVDSGIEILHA